MKTIDLWNALRGRPAATHVPARRIGVQHLGLAAADVQALQEVLDRVGEELGVELLLQSTSGEIVMLDVPFAARISPQLMHALTDGRPVVLISGLNREEEQGLPEDQRFARRHRVLLRQFNDISLVHRKSIYAGGAEQAPALSQYGPVSGFDVDFDSRFDSQQLLADEIGRGQQEVMQAVLRGLQDSQAPALTASYGTDANVRFDFRSRLVTMDGLALEHLRVHRELPQPAAGAHPGSGATVRDLDATLWDLGIAAGNFRLLDAPADWWYTPLASAPAADIVRHTRVPGHLDMARRLAAGPITPSELRRQSRVGVAELRRFVQACLVLDLVQWMPQASDARSA